MPPSDMPNEQSGNPATFQDSVLSMLKDFLSGRMQDFLTYVRMHDSETTILVLHVSLSRT